MFRYNMTTRDKENCVWSVCVCVCVYVCGETLNLCVSLVTLLVWGKLSNGDVWLVIMVWVVLSRYVVIL